MFDSTRTNAVNPASQTSGIGRGQCFVNSSGGHTSTVRLSVVSGRFRNNHNRDFFATEPRLSRRSENKIPFIVLVAPGAHVVLINSAGIPLAFSSHDSDAEIRHIPLAIFHCSLTFPIYSTLPYTFRSIPSSPINPNSYFQHLLVFVTLGYGSIVCNLFPANISFDRSEYLQSLKTFFFLNPVCSVAFNTNAYDFCKITTIQHEKIQFVD